MSGSSKNYARITQSIDLIAAANRPNVLDPALLNFEDQIEKKNYL